MKVFVSLGNRENCVNSAGNLVNPGFVRIFYPVGRRATGRDIGILCFIGVQEYWPNNILAIQ
ncbi:hypothetical protein M2131_001269 [Polynucleobacter sphagniphilus]|nr:hypothetical protein [Polynucleobacter sphagniphilus]